MKRWGIGVIGAGLIADFHARAIGDLPNAELVGFCDSITERAQSLAQKYSCQAFQSLEDLLANDRIEVVSIATPSGAHLEPAVAAAQAGKHVLCEKPLEITLERIDAMVSAHDKAGTKLGGIFQNRFNEAMIPLKTVIKAGRFGVITYAGIYVPWWRTDEYYKDSWHGTWKLDGGGALMNQSIHMVDMLCDLMPNVESVQAFTSNLGHPQIEAEDTAVAVVRFTGGALGVIYGTTASYPGQFKRFEITGTKGTVIYLEDSFTVWQFSEETEEDEQVRKKFSQTKGLGGVADPAAIDYKNHAHNFKAFLHAVEKNETFEINAQEARKSIELILAVYKSSREQKSVQLSPRT